MRATLARLTRAIDSLMKSAEFGHLVVRASFTLLLCVRTSVTCADASASLRERFEKEAPAAWIEGIQASQDVELQTIATTKSWTEDGKEWITREDTLLKSHGDMVLEQTTNHPAEGRNVPDRLRRSSLPKSRVEAINATDAFILNREGTADWVVNFVKPVSNDRTITRIRQVSRMLLVRPWYFAEDLLPTLYNRKDFHLDRVGPTENDSNSEPLVRISFTCSPKSQNDKPESVLQSGWIDLRPAAHWSIRRGEAELKYRNGNLSKMTVAIDYRPNQETDPLKSTLSVHAVGKSRGYDETIDFVTFERKSIPASDFTMAAYGIHMATEPQRNLLPWIVLNISIILLIIGVILYRRFFVDRSHGA